MLRRTLLASAGAMALTGAALAAEPAPAPLPPPPPPIYSWTGFYAGINAGGHWSSGSTTQFTGTDTNVAFGGGLGAALAAGEIPSTGASGASGFIGGGGFGYNYQINSFVVGLEVDFDGATGRRSSDALLSITIPPAFIVPPTSTQSSQQLDWLGTLRGRIGWTPIDRLLIFGTGGLAFGQSTASFSVVNPQAFPPLSAFASSSRWVGWAAGGGLEYALPDNWFNWSNWSVKVEYLYYDLGNSTRTVSYQNPDPVTLGPEFSTLSGHTRHSGNIVRAGLNYKFWGGPAPAPVVAKY